MKSIMRVFFNCSLTAFLLLSLTLVLDSCGDRKGEGTAVGDVPPFMNVSPPCDGTTPSLLAEVCAYYQFPDSFFFYDDHGELATVSMHWPDTVNMWRLRRYLEGNGREKNENPDEKSLFLMRFLGFDAAPLRRFTEEEVDTVLRSLRENRPTILILHSQETGKNRQDSWLVNGFRESGRMLHCIRGGDDGRYIGIDSLMMLGKGNRTLSFSVVCPRE